MAHFGLIEGGGTKIVLGIGTSAGKIVARHRVPTMLPGETLSACSHWFQAQNKDLSAIGIAFFGPLDVDRKSASWGRITRTTKPHWSGVDVAGHFASQLQCPIGIETDVDGAALGELKWGAGQGHASLLYLTIGTGVGGGFVTNGHLLRGLSHPEMGHIRVPQHSADGNFSGICPFHNDCLEGMASGPAILARWGQPLSDLPACHLGHGMIAWYLGQAVCSFQAIMEPSRIVMGGGVMQTPGLIDKVRVAAYDAGRGYFTGDPKTVIVAPGLGSDSGLMGALAIALDAGGGV
jgi:fructokinase